MVPYDKTVEAATWDPEAFKAFFKECQPKLARNVADTFFRQSTISRRAAQRLAAQAIGREDLWDETKKGLNSGWHAAARGAREGDEAVKLLGDTGDTGGDAGEKLEGAKLSRRMARTTRRRWRRCSGKWRRCTPTWRMWGTACGRGGALEERERVRERDFRKFQDKMIAAMAAQKARVESVESAIDGLHRALQAALDERKSDDKKTRAVRAATRDGDANPPHNPRALLAREHELAVVLPEIRRGDKEPEARRERSSSWS